MFFHIYEILLFLKFSGRMILPFEPLTVTFHDMQYYVDTPLVILIELVLLHILSYKIQGLGVRAI